MKQKESSHPTTYFHYHLSLGHYYIWNLSYFKICIWLSLLPFQVNTISKATFLNNALIHSLTVFPQFPMTANDIQACWQPSSILSSTIKKRSSQKQYTDYGGPSIPTTSQIHEVSLAEMIKYLFSTKTNALYSQLKSLPSFFTKLWCKAYEDLFLP